MPIYVSDSGKDFKPAPEGLHPAVCVDVVDKGMVTGQFGTQHKIQLRWQLEERDSESGKRFMVVSTYTASLNEKATLRKVLESWRGRKFTADELEKFDLETLVGANCQIQIAHNIKDGGRTYANVQAIVRAAKGVPALRPEEYVRDVDRPKDGQPVETPMSHPSDEEEVPF